MPAKTKKIITSFSHLVTANINRANDRNIEYEFITSEDTDRALKQAEISSSEKEQAIERLSAELSDFVAELPLKSSMIRRFKRFGEDADEFEKEEIEEMLSSAMVNARVKYTASKGYDDRAFGDYLVEEINSEIGASPSHEVVNDWSDLYGVEDQVKAIVDAVESYYNISLDKEGILDQVMEECYKVTEDFVQKNDKTSGLDVVSRDGESQYYFAPLSDEIDDGQNKLSIPDFEEFGLGGLQPDSATLDFLRMAGISPMEIIKELREEMEYETLMKWNEAAKEDLAFVKGAKAANLHDVLDVLEHCGGRGGIPVYVTEILPSSFVGPVDGEPVIFDKVGLTMIPDDAEIDAPALVALEAPVEFAYRPEQMLPVSIFGIDPMKEASLKPGELVSSLSPIKMDIGRDKDEKLDRIREELLEIQEDLGM